MAKSNLFLLFILLMASFFSICHSLTLFSIPINEVHIRGLLLCSLNGDPNAPPVSNGTVYLRCGGSNTTLAQAVTDPVGVFNFVLNVTETVTVNPSDCVIIANLPTGSCLIAAPDATLTASVNLVRIVITSLITIANYAASVFLNEDIYG